MILSISLMILFVAFSVVIWLLRIEVKNAYSVEVAQLHDQLVLYTNIIKHIPKKYLTYPCIAFISARTQRCLQLLRQQGYPLAPELPADIDELLDRYLPAGLETSVGAVADYEQAGIIQKYLCELASLVEQAGLADQISHAVHDELQTDIRRQMVRLEFDLLLNHGKLQQAAQAYQQALKSYQRALALCASVAEDLAEDFILEDLLDRKAALECQLRSRQRDNLKAMTQEKERVTAPAFTKLANKSVAQSESGKYN